MISIRYLKQIEGTKSQEFFESVKTALAERASDPRLKSNKVFVRKDAESALAEVREIATRNGISA